MATLRDPQFRQSTVTQDDLDALRASGMSDIGRGWDSGRIGADINSAAADVAALRTSQDPMDQARADELEKNIASMKLRQAAVAPRVGRVEDIDGLGSAASWAAGQVGQGAASMLDPVAASAALQGAGNIVGRGPGLMKGAGAALRGAGYVVPYLMNRQQQIGEVYGNMTDDPTLMRNSTAQQRYDAANLAGSAGAVLDTALPGMIGGKLAGNGLRQGLSRTGVVPRVLGEMGFEGLTETAQGDIGRVALTHLNPNRDTSGDMSARINDFAGGAVGSGPFSLGGELADHAFRRTGVAADGVKEAAGSTVDLLSKTAAAPIIDKAKAKMGDTIDLSGFKGDDGRIDLNKVLDTAKAGAVDLGEQVRTVATGTKRDPRLAELLDFNPMDDNAVPQDVALGGPERINQWRNERLAMKDDFIQEEIQKLSDQQDTTARQLMDRIDSAETADDLNHALEESGQYIKHQWDSADRAAVGERALGLARALGAVGASTAKAVGKTAAEVGKAVWEGARQGAQKNEQGADPGVGHILRAELPEDGVGRADKAALETFADVLAKRIDSLARMWKKAPTNVKTALGGTRHYNVLNLAEDIGAVYGDRAPDVLAQLAQQQPALADVVPALTEQVQNLRTPAGRKAQQSARLAMANKLMSMVPAPVARTLQSARRTDLLNAVERVAEGSAAPGMRKALEEALGKDTLTKMIGQLNESPMLQPRKGAAPGEAIGEDEAAPKRKVSESDEQDGSDKEEGTDYEKRAAEKRVSSGAAPSLYGFSKSPTLKNSIRDRDPFAPHTRPAKGETPKRPRLFKKDEKLSEEAGGGDAIKAKIAAVEKHLGVDRDEISPNDPYRVSPQSALDVMRRLNMQPAKMLALFRDYLRQEASDMKGTDAALAGRFNDLAEQAANAALDSMDGGKNALGGVPRLTKEQTTEVHRQLVRFFSNRFVVVAEQLADRVPEKLTAGEVDDFIKTAKSRLSAIDGAAHKRGATATDKIDAAREMHVEQNILYFTHKDGSEAPIRARDLVQWVRSQQAMHEEHAAPPSGWDRDDVFLADLLSGINAVLASERVKSSLPTMRSRFGKVESFADGIPDSLRLETQTQWKRRQYAEKKAGDKERKDTITDTRSGRYHAKVIREQGPDRRESEGVDAVPDSEAVRPEFVAEGMTAEEEKQYAALPTAKERAEFRKGLALRTTGEGYVPGQTGKTDSADKTPLDFYPERKRGAVPDERDDQNFRTRNSGESAYSPLPHEPAMTALGKLLDDRASRLERDLSGGFVLEQHRYETGVKEGQEKLNAKERADARAAQQAGINAVATRLRSAMRPAYAKADEIAGGFHYIYPALKALNSDLIDSYAHAAEKSGSDWLVPAVADARAKALRIIADADVKPEVKLKAVRMIAPKAALSRLNEATMAKYLEDNAAESVTLDELKPAGPTFADTTRDVSKKPLPLQERPVGTTGEARSLPADTYARSGEVGAPTRNIKVRQPKPAAPAAAPKEGLQATIDRYHDYIANPPANWAPERVQQIATWAGNREAALKERLAEMDKKVDDPSFDFAEYDRLDGQRFSLKTLAKNAQDALQQHAEAMKADPVLFSAGESNIDTLKDLKGQPEWHRDAGSEVPAKREAGWYAVMEVDDDYGQPTAKLGARRFATKEEAEAAGDFGARYIGGDGAGSEVPAQGPKSQPAPAGARNAQQNGPYLGWKSGTPSTDKEVAEAKAYIDRVLGPKVKVDFEQTLGHSGEWIEASETIKIALNAAAGIMPTAYHEAMHAFFSRYVKSNPKVLKTMKALAENEQVLARVQALLHGFPAAQAQLRDGEERLAYIYQFWAAGKLDIPIPAARTWLQKLRKFFRQVLGRVSAEERAGAILEALHEGKLRDPDAAQRVLADMVADKAWTTKARRNFDGLIQGVAALSMPAHDILSKSASPAAQALAAQLYTGAGDGKEAGTPGYLNAVRSERMRRINGVAAAIEGLSDRDRADVTTYLQQAKDPATIPYAPHRKAVEMIRKELDDFWSYSRAAGVDLGKIKEYFPVVWDTSKLVQEQEAFVQMMLEHYRPQMQQAMQSAAAHGVTLTAEQAARRLHTVIVDRQAFDGKLAVGREDGVLVPFFESAMNRELDWIAPEHREPFLEKSLVGTLSRYFHQGVRAAEYTRRFGADGKRLEASLRSIEQELQKAAGSMPGLDTTEKQNAWVTRQMRDVNAAVGAMEGTLGKDISDTHRRVNSWLTVYQNVRLLPLALFSSFVDPLAMVARGAEFKEAGEAFTRGMREVFRGWSDVLSGMPKERQKDEWENMAEFIGATEAAMFAHHVSEEYSSQYMSPRAKRINDMMFKLNGMEAWNRGMRVGATKGAVQFVIKHSTNPERHSRRWLRELGLGAEDVVIRDGKLLVSKNELMSAGLPTAKAEEVQARMLNALNRWVEGAVLTPSSAQRPAWSSDPRWSFLFHLKQFTYSFHQTILRRAVGELKQGNMAPMGALALFVPTMIATDITKGLVLGGGELPRHMKGMDAGDWMLHGVQRAGVAGYGQVAADAGADWSSLAGPSVEQVVDGFRQPLGDTLVKALPAHALYREALR